MNIKSYIQELLRKVVRIRFYIIALISCGAFVYCEFCDFKKQNEVWRDLIIVLSSSICASSICLIIFELSFKKNEQAEKVDSNKKITEITTNIEDINRKLALKSAGINGVYTEDAFNAQNGYANLFNNSTTATCILNHGNRFYEKHLSTISERFSKEEFSTKCFFLEPDENSDSIKVLSYRTGTPPRTLIKYITENVKNLKNAYNNSTKYGSLEIYYMKCIPMQAIYLFDNTIVECKYYSSRERGDFDNIILHERTLGKKTIFNGFVKDCRCIENESKCFFSSRIEPDNSFREFLSEKLPIDGNISTYNTLAINTPNEIGIVKIKLSFTNPKQTLICGIGSRYYKNEDNLKSNMTFCIKQFVNSSIDKQIPLYFIVGIGGTPNEPEEIRVQKFDKNLKRFISSNYFSTNKRDFRAADFN